MVVDDEKVKASLDEKKTEAQKLVSDIKKNIPFFNKFKTNWLEDSLSSLGEEYLNKEENQVKIKNFLKEESENKLTPHEKIRASVEGMNNDEYLAREIDKKLSNKFLIDKLRQSSRVSDINKKPIGDNKDIDNDLKDNSESIDKKSSKGFDVEEWLKEERAKESKIKADKKNQTGVKAQVQRMLEKFTDKAENTLNNRKMQKIVSTASSIKARTSNQFGKLAEKIRRDDSGMGR